MPQNSSLPETDADRIVAHMNAEHPEDLVRYAKAFADVKAVDTAHMTSLDAEGFTLEIAAAGATTTVRIDFEASLDTVAEARSTLVDLAMRARKRTEGEE